MKTYGSAVTFLPRNNLKRPERAELLEKANKYKKISAEIATRVINETGIVGPHTTEPVPISENRFITISRFLNGAGGERIDVGISGQDVEDSYPETVELRTRKSIHGSEMIPVASDAPTVAPDLPQLGFTNPAHTYQLERFSDRDHEVFQDMDKLKEHVAKLGMIATGLQEAYPTDNVDADYDSNKYLLAS